MRFQDDKRSRADTCTPAERLIMSDSVNFDVWTVVHELGHDTAR
jgi:hypothetical protein